MLPVSSLPEELFLFFTRMVHRSHSIFTRLTCLTFKHTSALYIVYYNVLPFTI
jgi:hypothetical protein